MKAKRDWGQQLADAVRIARGNESQSDLAARCKVSDRTISMIELAQLKEPPRASTLIRLAVATGQNAEEWLRLAGVQVRPADIEREKQLVGARTAWNQLEPADAIKQDVRAYINRLFVPADELRVEFEKKISDHISEYLSRLTSTYEPAADLRAAIIRQVDLRLSEYEGIVQAQRIRIDQLNSRVEELARELDEMWSDVRQSARRTRQAERKKR